MPNANQQFEAITWGEILQALEQLVASKATAGTGLRFSEVTDLFQSQLTGEPLLAARMNRVIELRFARLAAVAYLRTGVFAGEQAAAYPAGAMLLCLRYITPTGEVRYIKYPRIKRTRNWAANLKRRVREVIEDCRGRGSGCNHAFVLGTDQGPLLASRKCESGCPERSALSVASTLVQLLTVTDHDLEPVPVPAAQEEPGSPWVPARAANLRLAALHEPAGRREQVSLPVLLCVLLSLAVLIVMVWPDA